MNNNESSTNNPIHSSASVAIHATTQSLSQALSQAKQSLKKPASIKDRSSPLVVAEVDEHAVKMFQVKGEERGVAWIH